MGDVLTSCLSLDLFSCPHSTAAWQPSLFFISISGTQFQADVFKSAWLLSRVCMQYPLDGAAALSPECGLQMRLLLCWSTWEPASPSWASRAQHPWRLFSGGVSAWTCPGGIWAFRTCSRCFLGGTGPAQTVGLGGRCFDLGQPVFGPWSHCVLVVTLDNALSFLSFFLKKILLIYFYRERKKERQKHWCEREALMGCLSYEPVSQACALTGNPTGNLLPHRSGLHLVFLSAK